jgi:hypothetical protein
LQKLGQDLELAPGVGLGDLVPAQSLLGVAGGRQSCPAQTLFPLRVEAELVVARAQMPPEDGTGLGGVGDGPNEQRHYGGWRGRRGWDLGGVPAQ